MQKKRHFENIHNYDTIEISWYDYIVLICCNVTINYYYLSFIVMSFHIFRYLYFNSLASYHQNYADTYSLIRSEYMEPVVFQSNYKRASQAGVQATSQSGVIFFQLVQLTAIACWDIGKPFTPENVVIIAQDEETLQYVSGIKVITNSLGEEELWFNTNRLQKTINMTRKSTEINLRIIRGTVVDIIRGTRCEPIPSVKPRTPDTLYWHLV